MDDQGRDPKFITIGDLPVEVGSSPQAGLRLSHPSIAQRHAILTWTDEGKGISVVDQGSVSGTFFNDAHITKACVPPGGRIRFGEATTYRVQRKGLKRDLAARGAGVTVAGLTICKDGKLLVEDACFSIRPNSFVGILGPSGAGKSTLLNCLAGYGWASRGRIVFYGDRDLAEHPEEYRAILGHVSQDDIVYPGLTVLENLRFAASIRLDLPQADRELAGAVEQALEWVSLKEEHRRKAANELSGGQRKRLSVALEFLKPPRVLLLDEPTSGLDPAGETNLMEELGYMTRCGTTVICTTHQMENVEKFDEVVVLGLVPVAGQAHPVGRVAYVGPPDKEKLCEHFECLNLADVYEKLEAGDFTPLGNDAFSAPSQQTAGSIALRIVEPRGPKRESSAVRRPPARMATRDLVARTTSRSAWRQASRVGSRALLNIRRDRGLLMMMSAQPLVLGLLVGLTQFNALSVKPLYFFSVVLAIWLGLNNSARALVRDRKHYVRESLSGLRSGPYLGAHAAVYAIIGVGQLVLMLGAVWLSAAGALEEIASHPLQETSWPWFFLVLLLCYGCGLGLGLLTSVLARSEEAAVAALPLLIMPQLLLSALAAGQIHENYDKALPFRPVVVTFAPPDAATDADASPISLAGRSVDALSMFCYSRPGLLALESPTVGGHTRYLWLGDLCHLLILLLGTWLLVCLAFLWAEEKWPHQIGFG